MVDGQLVIDADAHVEESEEVWRYVEKEFWERRPVAVTLDNAPSLGNVNAFWLVDGRPTHRPIGKGANLTLTPITMEAAKAKEISLGSQSLLDVPARLRDMDSLGLDVQVLFPSCFNRPMAEDPRLETALHRAWNRWVIDATRQASRRLKPIAIMPLQEPEEAIREARWAKENGAVGLGVYPMMGGRLLDHPAFEPFYIVVNELDLPLCLHVGWYIPELTNLFDTVYMNEVFTIAIPSMLALGCLVKSGVFDRYPRLRVGLFEAGSTWVPYFVERMDLYYRVHERQNWWRPDRLPSEYLAERRVYFTFEPDEGLLVPAMERLGAEIFMLSSDMPHAELREGAAREVARRADLSPEVKRKIFSENAIRFFGPAIVP
jgi:predicted TIM-barrel fold metal-dependent hydrolase